MQANANLGAAVRQQRLAEAQVDAAHAELDRIEKEYSAYDNHLTNKYKFAPGTALNLETGEFEV